MEVAVTAVLADVLSQLTARDVVSFARLHTEPKDRFSGRRRSPQRRNLWQPQVVLMTRLVALSIAS